MAYNTHRQDDGLTREMITAIKTADRLQLSYDSIEGLLRCEKDVNNGPYTGKVCYNIEVGGIVVDYTSRLAIEKMAYICHTALLPWADDGAVWDLLQVGDKLDLKWVCGNNSPRLEEAGLASDYVSAVITHKGKPRQFMLTYEVNGINSPSRMVHPVSS